MLDTGLGRKSDVHDAHSVAVAAVRAKELRVLSHDPQLEALRMLSCGIGCRGQGTGG